MSRIVVDDSELRAIYSSAPVVKDTFEVFELAATWFSKTYYLQFAFADSIYVPLEDGETEVLAQYAPMSITQAAQNEDLSYERTLNIQYVNDIIAFETSRFDPVDNKGDYPTMTSRLYVMYRDGTVSALKSSPISTIITEVTRDNTGASISTSTTPTNRQTTGEVCTVTRVPMLKAFL